MSRVGKSSISFGGDDDTYDNVRPSVRPAAHAGGGKSSISFGGGDDDTERVRTSVRPATHAGGGKSSISFGGDDLDDVPSRSKPALAAGGKSSISFAADDNDDDTCRSSVRKASPPSSSGGGKSNVKFGGNADDSDDDSDSGHAGSRTSHGTSKSSIVFGGEEDESEIANSTSSSIRIGKTSSAGGGSSQLVFGDERPDHDPGATQLTSRVLHPSAKSQISFNGEGEGDEERVNSFTGIARGDANGRQATHSSLMFDGHADAPPPEGSRPVFRAADKSSTGGRSRIQFGNEDEDEEDAVNKATKGVNRLGLSGNSTSKPSSSVGGGLPVDNDDPLSRPRPANASYAGRGGVRDPNRGELSNGFGSTNDDDDHHNKARLGSVRNPNLHSKEETTRPVFKAHQKPGGDSSISFY
ncbi:hypothetical protein BDF22DRAFT_657981 [Syncephalis plumigaleata]|nr:hypothetical protein BDF22DRAFT_657981 [Syncephalis plumigaleata]